MKIISLVMVREVVVGSRDGVERGEWLRGESASLVEEWVIHLNNEATGLVALTRTD